MNTSQGRLFNCKECGQADRQHDRDHTNQQSGYFIFD
jgi:hypothetical protein